MSWADVMIVFAMLLFLGLLLRGAIKFSPRRARNVKYAEFASRARPPSFHEIQKAHPEIVKVARLDRHPWYLIPHMCVFGYTMCVFLGAKLTSNVIALGAGPRYTMASCFLIGSILVLAGSSLGAKVGDHVVKPDVREHLTSTVLGDDITLPYRLAIAGMSAMVVSAGIYAWTSFQTTTGSLGGWFTGGVVVSCLSTSLIFYRSVDTFQKWDHLLISEAKERAGICDVQDDHVSG